MYTIYTPATLKYPYIFIYAFKNQVQSNLYFLFISTIVLYNTYKFLSPQV